MINLAIVIGGSIAGLLTARILADYCSQVIIIDKDQFPLEPGYRSGVPQSVQPHVLLGKGYQIIEELFAGISRELEQNGALKLDFLRDLYYYGVTGWSINVKEATNFDSEIISFTCSRPLLEGTIRQRLKQFSNIQILEGYKVLGLLRDSDKEKITGVRCQVKDNSGEKELLANLIVDASGWGSNSPKWLEQLGFATPSETIIN